MNTFWKIFFWIMVIGLAFVNPLISFGLLVLYYLPSIVSSLCKECVDVIKSTDLNSSEAVESEKINLTINFSKQPTRPQHDMKKFSDDTLEDMK